MISASDTTFNRRVLHSDLPATVLFMATGCAASAALARVMRDLAAGYAERLLVATVHTDRSPMLVSQYAIQSTPTLCVYRYGQEVLRVPGYLPRGLLKLLFEEALVTDGDVLRYWAPIEEQFEDVVIIPMLAAWGWRYSRQHPCMLPGQGAAARGRVDVLVYESDPAEPLTLFENKRMIATNDDLRRAVGQARAYAEALHVPSFLVAAPAGVWVYACTPAGVRLAGSMSALELEQAGERLQELIIQGPGRGT